MATVPVSSDPSRQLDAARRFAADAARLLADTRCADVVVLDVSGVSPVTDFLVIATGTSPRQMKTAADDLNETARACGFASLSRAADDGSSWTCIDFVDVVVHLFNREARSFYDLESLWGDAARVAWRTPPESGN